MADDGPPHAFTHSHSVHLARSGMLSASSMLCLGHVSMGFRYKLQEPIWAQKLL